MKAMILAAGIGSRLGDITKSIPKCLVEVGSKTLLEHVFDRLKSVGVSYVVINLHHFAEQVSAYLAAHNNFGIEVHFSTEAELLETGGGIFHARHHFADCEHFIVHNADVFHQLNLTALIKGHIRNSPLATLLVMQRETKRYLVFDSNDNLIGRVNAKGETQLIQDASVQNLFAFCGIQIINPKIFSHFDGLPQKFSVIEGYLKAVTAGGNIKGFLTEGEWSDVGTPERLELLRQT